MMRLINTPDVTLWNDRAHGSSNGNKNVNNNINMHTNTEINKHTLLCVTYCGMEWGFLWTRELFIRAKYQCYEKFGLSPVDNNQSKADPLPYVLSFVHNTLESRQQLLPFSDPNRAWLPQLPGHSVFAFSCISDSLTTKLPFDIFMCPQKTEYFSFRPLVVR